jgi:hypothetical protein
MPVMFEVGIVNIMKIQILCESIEDIIWGGIKRRLKNMVTSFQRLPS